MSAVHMFDPTRQMLPDAQRIDRLLRASTQLDLPDYGFTSDEIHTLAPLMRANPDDWHAAASKLDDEQLLGLVRLLTLAETLPEWEALERSPVIALIAELRQRDALPKDIIAWIRAHSSNRFLPWGSLQSRL